MKMHPHRMAFENRGSVACPGFECLNSTLCSVPVPLCPGRETRSPSSSSSPRRRQRQAQGRNNHLHSSISGPDHAEAKIYQRLPGPRHCHQHAPINVPALNPTLDSSLDHRRPLPTCTYRRARPVERRTSHGALSNRRDRQPERRLEEPAAANTVPSQGGQVHRVPGAAARWQGAGSQPAFRTGRDRH